MRIRSALAILLSTLLLACSGSGDDGDDTIVTDVDAGNRDGGQLTQDAGDDRDGGDNRDGGMVTPDAGMMDRDAGVALTPELMPGQYVQVAEGRVTIGVDTLAEVQAKLGMGTRSAAMNARSYEWSLSDGVMLTVWFANVGIGPVGTIGADATVLWASVQGGFTGTTPGGVGISTARAAVEADLGVAPHEVPLTMPTGTLLQYFTTGILVAVDDAGATRTITIHRAYNVAPDGEIDPRNVRIRLSNGDVEGFGGIGNQGTRISNIRTRLGEPDAEGDIMVSGQMLHTLSYAFMGIEIFQVDNGIIGNDRVAFMNIHAPYYGVTNPGNATVGSTRTDIESFLSSEGYSNAMASGTANFFCYTHPSDEGVGVTYSTDTPPVMTSMTIPLLQCP